MPSKYEVIEINQASITVDVSALAKSDMLFFNATQMAKPFGKRPDDFWKQAQNRSYLDALVTLSEGNENDFLYSKRGGKYQGTWFHKDLALQFARWLSPLFAVKLDKWIVERINQAHEWINCRLESRTGYKHLSNAVLSAHDPVKPYHFMNEADMINRIVLGMSAKQFRTKYGVESVRDSVSPSQLAMIELLQRMETTFIEAGMEYDERKDRLKERFDKGLPQYLQIQEKAA